MNDLKISRLRASDPPLCSIIGQSNSIYSAGYCGVLLRTGGIKLAGSGRLGASPSVIGPFFAADGALFDAEYVVIDCCVIDMNGPTSHGWSLHDIRSWVEWIGHSARLQGCEPIFLLIPAATALAGTNAVLATYEDVIQQHRYCYLDVRDVLKEIPEDPLTLFRDVAHPGERVSERIANLLAKFMVARRSHKENALDVHVSVKDFVRINIQDHTDQGPAAVTHATTLLNFRGISLEEGVVARVQTGPCRKLHAVMVNSYRSRGNLSICGRESITKAFSFRPYGTGGVCEARLIPIQSTVTDRAGFLEFMIAPSDATPSEVTAALKPMTVGERAEIEISDLLIETGETMHDYRAYICSDSNNILDLVN